MKLNLVDNYLVNYATIKRKTKSKGSFPTEESAFRVIYLATQEQQEKWNMSSIRNCFEIYTLKGHLVLNLVSFSSKLCQNTLSTLGIKGGFTLS